MFVQSDVVNEAAVKTAIQTANDFMGGITFAVNCAGIATAGRTLGREGTWPTENFNRVIQVNSNRQLQRHQGSRGRHATKRCQ